MNSKDCVINLTRELSIREEELVNKYWLFSDQYLFKFVYSVAELNLEFDDLLLNKKEPISKVVAKLAYVTNHNNVCPICKKTYKFFLRPTPRDMRVFTPAKCDECKKELAKKIFDQEIVIVRNYINHFSFPTTTFSINGLSYLECLYLYICIDSAREDGLILIDSSICSEELDDQVLLELLNKDIIYLLCTEDADWIKLKESISNIRFQSHALEKQYTEQLNRLLLQVPTTGFYLLPPINDSLENYKKQLIRNLEDKINLELDEIKLIENTIRLIFREKAISLIKTVEKHFKFYAKKDQDLLNTINYTIWNYPLGQVYSMFYHAGSRVASDLHAKNIHSAIAPKLFNSHLKNFMNYVEENPQPKKYLRNLPASLPLSKMETLTCALMFENVFSWEMLSGNQVLKIWLERPYFKKTGDN